MNLRKRINRIAFLFIVGFIVPTLSYVYETWVPLLVCFGICLFAVLVAVFSATTPGIVNVIFMVDNENDTYLSEDRIRQIEQDTEETLH